MYILSSIYLYTKLYNQLIDIHRFVSFHEHYTKIPIWCKMTSPSIHEKEEFLKETFYDATMMSIFFPIGATEPVNMAHFSHLKV